MKDIDEYRIYNDCCNIEAYLTHESTIFYYNGVGFIYSIDSLISINLN